LKINIKLVFIKPQIYLMFGNPDVIKRVLYLCEMFLTQIWNGHITQIKVRQFLSELKDYIEESNDGVTP
jgi:hypothetical protein